MCEETYNKINNPMAEQPVEGESMPFDYWTLVHLSTDRNEVSPSQFMGDV